MRNTREAGKAGIGPGGRLGGTGGSRTPMPVSLWGGPPERAEEDAVSGSNSFSANSYGIEKSYLLRERCVHCWNNPRSAGTRPRC